MVRERGERPSEKALPPPTAVPPKLAAPIDWWKLDDAERAETLEVLFVWVPELVRRYGLAEQIVPPCWYQHEAIVQELLALFQYRNQQQYLDIAPPSAPLDFHTQLQYVITRLRMWVGMSECTLGRHNDTILPSWASQQVGEWGAEAWIWMEDHLGNVGTDSYPPEQPIGSKPGAERAEEG
ncbi:MAG: hypothetical protein ACK5LO_13635 [Leucobacter sp.]